MSASESNAGPRTMRSVARSFAMRTLTALLTACVACGGSEGENGQSSAGFVGTVVPPFPADLATAGMHVFPPDSLGTYALDLVFGAERQMLWLTRLTSGDDATAPREVVAVLDIPRGEQNVSLVYTPGACSLDGRADPEVVALAQVTFTPVLDPVVLAWRADRAGGRFVEVATAGVTCHNPRYPGAAPSDS